MGWNALYAKGKDYWRDFAEDARRQGSPLYAMLAGAIDGDESLKALTAGPRDIPCAIAMRLGRRRISRDRPRPLAPGLCGKKPDLSRRIARKGGLPAPDALL
jgi:hypothetical protein